MNTFTYRERKKRKKNAGRGGEFEVVGARGAVFIVSRQRLRSALVAAGGSLEQVGRLVFWRRKYRKRNTSRENCIPFFHLLIPIFILPGFECVESVKRCSFPCWSIAGVFCTNV